VLEPFALTIFRVGVRAGFEPFKQQLILSIRRLKNGSGTGQRAACGTAGCSGGPISPKVEMWHDYFDA
jgi:hypothetical protein